MAMLAGYSASVCIHSSLTNSEMEDDAAAFYADNYQRMYEVTRDFLHYFYAGNEQGTSDAMFWKARKTLNLGENVGASQAFCFLVNTIPANPARAQEADHMYLQFMDKMDHPTEQAEAELGEKVEAMNTDQVLEDGSLSDDAVPQPNGALESSWQIDGETHTLRPIRGIAYDQERPVLSSTSAGCSGATSTPSTTTRQPPRAHGRADHLGCPPCGTGRSQRAERGRPPGRGATRAGPPRSRPTGPGPRRGLTAARRPGAQPRHEVPPLAAREPRHPWVSAVAGNIAAVVFVVATLLGFVRGYESAVARDVDRMGFDLLVTARGCPYEAATLMLRGGVGLRYMPDGVVSRLDADPAVAATYPTLIHPLRDPDSPSGMALVKGVTPGFRDARRLELSDGNWLGESPGVVLGLRPWNPHSAVQAIPCFSQGRRPPSQAPARTGSQLDGTVLMDLGEAQERFSPWDDSPASACRRIRAIDRTSTHFASGMTRGRTPGHRARYRHGRAPSRHGGPARGRQPAHGCARHPGCRIARQHDAVSRPLRSAPPRRLRRGSRPHGSARPCWSRPSCSSGSARCSASRPPSQPGIPPVHCCLATCRTHRDCWSS